MCSRLPCSLYYYYYYIGLNPYYDHADDLHDAITALPRLHPKWQRSAIESTLGQVVLDMMQPDPSQRPSLRAVIQQLRQVQQQEQQPVTF